MSAGGDTGFWRDEVAVDERSFQRAALDPERSVAIQACAGSGKTWLLVGRIVRILIEGVRPSEILAITFTRKACEEMRSRILSALERLALDEDERALVTLESFGLDAADAHRRLPAARGLLERLLDDNELITIETFHGWFGQIVRGAPLAAGVAQGYSIVEDIALIEAEARRRLYARISRDADLRAHYLELLRCVGERAAWAMLHELIARRNEWTAYLDGRTLAEGLAELATQLSVTVSRDPIEEFFSDAGRAADILRLIELAAGAGKDNARRAQIARAALANDENRGPRAFAAVRTLLFTKDNRPRQMTAIWRTAAARVFRGVGGAPEDPVRFDEWVGGLVASIESTATAATENEVWRLNRAGWHCAAALVEELQAIKGERGALDFTDLEGLAARLCADPVSGAYIQARLDRRYRHILVDEFQDTNPLQWSTLRNWLGAYAGGAEAPRLFIVGDATQSIYRFRRAEARLFDEAERFLLEHLDGVRLRTTHTRRCARAVVDFVNHIFVGAHPGFRAHHTANPALGAVWRLPLAAEPEGAVEIDADDDDETGFEAEAPGQAPPSGVLRDILRTPAPEELDLREVRAADSVAAAVAWLLATYRATDRDRSDAGTRALRFSDVLILVRKRKALPALERALRRSAIPFASDRRGGLLTRLEVLDVCALLKLLVVPFSDLQLVHVLRSPLFGFLDEDLIALAHQRPTGASWWRTLQTSPDTRLFAAGERLESWRRLAGILPVHDLLDRIYHEGGLIERYAASVPDGDPGEVAQACANLTAFLELALELDSGRYPSLPRFIAELEARLQVDEGESPDEPPTDAGERVRLMTVHGAKGLEAPVVILADSASQPGNRDNNSVLIDWAPSEARPQHFSIYGRSDMRGRARAPWFLADQERALQEDWNLYYVAATRAREVLVLAGIEPKRRDPAPSWYGRASASVELLEPPTSGSPSSHASLDSVRVARFMPAAAPVGVRRSRETPASPGVDRSYGIHGDAARRHGIALHRALELSIDAPNSSERAVEVALACGLDAEGARAVAATVLAMRSAPHLQRFFNSRLYRWAANEVEFLDGAGAVVRIDRLVAFDDETWILDYKSGSSSVGLLPHRAQLQGYLAVVAGAYPGTPVRAALIFADAHLVTLDEGSAAT